MRPLGENAERKTASLALRLERTGRGGTTATGVWRGLADRLRADPVSLGGRLTSALPGDPGFEVIATTLCHSNGGACRLCMSRARTSRCDGPARAGREARSRRYPRRGAISVRATHTTSPIVSASAGQGSASIAGLSLARVQSGPRLAARLTTMPPSVRTT